MNRDRFIFEIAKIKPSQNYLKLKDYESELGQKFSADIVFNIPYEKALRDSITALKGYFPTDSYYVTAKVGLLKSFHDTLNNPPIHDEVDGSRFLPLLDENNKRVESARFDMETSTLHIFNFVHSKIISRYGKSVGRFFPIKETFKKICPALRFEKLQISPWKVELVTVENILLLGF